MILKCKYCNKEHKDCYCPKCNKCGSTNLFYHDNSKEISIECIDCGNWNE